MAYFHLDRVQAYIQSLGFRNVANRQVRANVDAIIDGPSTERGQDNSYFDPLTGELTFGTGFSDDAEDAETIVHEYAHVIQDDQVPGFPASDEAAAIAEGFGDYLASSVTARFTPNATFDACFNEWDAFTAGLGTCLRRVDWDLLPGQTSPDCPAPTDEHCRGEAWSGALWAIRRATGGSVTDRLVIQSHFSLTAASSFDVASRALLAADRALYGGAHQSVLKSVLGSRGLVDLERLDDGPREATFVRVPSTTSGRLSAGADTHDVYSAGLTRRQPIVIRLRATSGDFDLRLLPPGSTTVDAPAVAAAETASASEVIHYTPQITGGYYIDVRAISGSGPYTLEIASDDQDGDGIADDRDVCPTRADPRQRDWDADGKGDLCDRSASVSITSVAKARRRVRVRVKMLPTSLPARALRLRVSKRVCGSRRCSYRRPRYFRPKTVRGGRATLRFRLRPGRYRLRATERHREYRNAQSHQRGVRVQA
jgi:hypothetical protein